MKLKCVRRPVLVIGFIFLVASHVRAEGSAPCAALLTAAEVQSALGMEVETVDPVEYAPGFTVCSWTKDRPEGQLGVNFSFFELNAIREGMVSAESIPEYFDLQVSSKQKELGVEPETLEGIGKRSVLFSEEHSWIVMIELENGFAHLAISPTDIARSQVETMAKAVDSDANH